MPSATAWPSSGPYVHKMANKDFYYGYYFIVKIRIKMICTETGNAAVSVITLLNE